MSGDRDRLLALSRGASELELAARQVRHASGIFDALAAVQAAIARRLDRIETAPQPVEPAPDAAAVAERFRAHLRAAGRGEQARLARQIGIPPTTLGKFARTGQMGRAQVAQLAVTLDQAEHAGRSS